MTYLAHAPGGPRYAHRLRRPRTVARGQSHDPVVLQSEDQVELAGAAFPALRGVTRIPSFAQPAVVSPVKPEFFLWLSRNAHRVAA